MRVQTSALLPRPCFDKGSFVETSQVGRDRKKREGGKEMENWTY